MLCWEGGGSRRVVGDFDEVFLGKKKVFPVQISVVRNRSGSFLIFFSPTNLRYPIFS